MTVISSPIMDLSWLRRSRETDDTIVDLDDDVNVSIIDAMQKLNDQPPPYAGDWATPRRYETMPVPRVRGPKHAADPSPNPPPKQERRELHVTPPAGQRRLQPKRPSRGRVLKASRATLPIFTETARFLGWRAFIPPPTPRLTWTGAIQAIDVFTERSHRLICQQTEVARGDLWERAREYDMREAELRRPLNMQRGM